MSEVPRSPDTPTRCRVSVIIKAYNEEKRIEEALRSSLAAVAEVGGEVILADGHSTDRTAEIASAYPVRIVRLLDGNERSCGIGPQIGFQHSLGEYVYVMDADMQLRPGFLGEALDFLDAHRDVAGVGGRIVEMNLHCMEYRERALRNAAHLAPGEVDRLDGGGLYRREAVLQAGWLSDRNLHAYEEFDLAIRLRAAGWKLVRIPFDAVTHFGHDAPPYRLLLRRWRSRYARSPGELLRGAVGRPHWPLLWRDLRELRLYAAVVAWWFVLLSSVAWPLHGLAHVLAVLGIAMLPFAAIGLKKRSVSRAVYSVVSWNVHAAGMVLGLFGSRKPPQERIGVEVRHGAGLAESSLPATATAGDAPDAGVRAGAKGRFVYVACPWSPAGGGMFKVAEYLISAQHQVQGGEAVALRPLDTRGGGSAAASLLFLTLAMLRVLRGRLSGRLAGVHVNMAERMSFVRKGAIVVTCWMLGVPSIIHLHCEMRSFYLRMPAMGQRLTRWIFSLPASVVVIGTLGRRFVTDDLGVPEERVDLVENGVPGPATAPARPEPAAGGVPSLLFVGRMCDAKGVVDLLQAAARAHANGTALRLTFAGGGPEVERYAQLASSLGIASITHFAGWCDQQKVDRLLSEASALVLPSHDEVLPLVVLEALAHGLPVICTPVGELPHVFEDGVHVRFVPARQPETLAAVLQATLGDAQFMRTLSANGRAIYEERFSMPRFFTRIARVHGLRFGTSTGPSATRAGSEVNA